MCVCLLSFLIHYCHFDVALLDEAIKILYFLIRQTIYEGRLLLRCHSLCCEFRQPAWFTRNCSPTHDSHYSDVMMGAMASQITSLTIIHSTVYSGADQRKYLSPAPLDFVRGIHRWPVNSPHKGPITRKMFLFDDVIMSLHEGLLHIHKV